MKRNNAIDVLKAIAIIAVVLYHSGFLTYGYLGVDLFLVINGYFITKGLNKLLITEDASRRGEYFQFEISRIARLLPALLVAGIFCMAFGYFYMLPDDYENVGQAVIATNFFGNNILAAITTRDYWAVVNDLKPLMHTWYVGVIMQFYLIYPFVFYLARLNKTNSRGTLLVILSVLSFVSFLFYMGASDIAFRFYYLPARFFEFGVGGIIALTIKPSEGNNIFRGWFVYLCYALLVGLFVIIDDAIPSVVKLVLVVGLSAVLLISTSALDNKITGNVLLAKIGAASYSIFIWHQVLLAFYRYTISFSFTIYSYLLFIVAVAVLSWLTYSFVEKKTSVWLKEKRTKQVFYSILVFAFICSNLFAGYVYLHAGVMRDIPEMEINKSDAHRGMLSEYCDRAYQYDKPFETDKPHWLVVGNSFGRDFVNIILESNVADSVEISYIFIDDFKNQENASRFADADRVFLSTLDLTESLVNEVELQCIANGLSVDRLVIVGEKDFGKCNGHIYKKRNSLEYFEQYVEVEDYNRFIVQNSLFEKKYGNRFLNLMAFVTNTEGKVRVFTPDNHYISPDTNHLIKAGAKYFAEKIDWDKF